MWVLLWHVGRGHGLDARVDGGVLWWVCSCGKSWDLEL